MLTQDAAYVYGDAQGVYDVRPQSNSECVDKEMLKALQDFGGVVFDEEEARKVGDALGTSIDERTQITLLEDKLKDAGPQGKALILRNHGLLTVGHTVDEACFLMDLSE